MSNETNTPASVSIKYLYDGYDCLLTLRGDTGGDVLKAQVKAVEWLTDHGAGPTAQKIGYPAANGNGHAAPAAVGGTVAEGQAAATACNRIKVNVAEPDGKIKVEFWRDGTDPPRKYAEESVLWSPDRVEKLLGGVGLTTTPANHSLPVMVHYTIGRERPPKQDGTPGGRYHDVTRLELIQAA